MASLNSQQGIWRLLFCLPPSLRFIAVGACAAAVHFCVVWLLVESGTLTPLLANIIAFLVAFNVSYIGHRHLSFAEHATADLVPHQQALPRFFAIACGSFALNEILFYVALHTLHWPYQPALIAVLIIVAFGTFFASKVWAFRQGKKP